jgi:gentisate 1,2-dioxygenase
MPQKHKLTFEFDSPEALNHFARWLCGSGEQEYWEWMRCCEDQEPTGNITAVRFEYHEIRDKSLPSDDPKRYGEFLGENVIRTVCGRLDDSE